MPFSGASRARVSRPAIEAAPGLKTIKRNQPVEAHGWELRPFWSRWAPRPLAALPTGVDVTTMIAVRPHSCGSLTGAAERPTSWKRWRRMEFAMRALRCYAADPVPWGALRSRYSGSAAPIFL